MVKDIYVKYNQNQHKATVVRVHDDGRKELLDKEGNWQPHTDGDELLNQNTKINAYNVTPAHKGPPD